MTTRKSCGDFMGVAATGREGRMDVIDIIGLRDGKFVAHWGILDMAGLMAQLTAE